MLFNYQFTIFSLKTQFLKEFCFLSIWHFESLTIYTALLSILRICNGISIKKINFFWNASLVCHHEMNDFKWKPFKRWIIMTTFFCLTLIALLMDVFPSRLNQSFGKLSWFIFRNLKLCLFSVYVLWFTIHADLG